MTISTSPTPHVLVFGVGNPSRGDDAIGPLFIERAREMFADEIAKGDLELLTDFQLQVEHALDLTNRDCVVFVDASVSAAAPFEYGPVEAALEPSFSTHVLSPEEVLETYRTITGTPPPAWVLAIRGESFELGDALSPAAAANLDAALSFLRARLRGPLTEAPREPRPSSATRSALAS